MFLYTFDDIDRCISRSPITTKEEGTKLAEFSKVANFVISDEVYAPKSIYFNNGICKYTDEEIQLRDNVPEGFVWVMPDRKLVDKRSIEDAQHQAIDRIKYGKSIEEVKPFLYKGNTYDANSNAINGAMLKAITNPQYSTLWTTATNTEVVLNAEDLIGLGSALHDQINAAHEKSRKLKAAVYQPNQTIEQIDSITW